jgi:hypothetical protein
MPFSSLASHVWPCLCWLGLCDTMPMPLPYPAGARPCQCPCDDYVGYTSTSAMPIPCQRQAYAGHATAMPGHAHAGHAKPHLRWPCQCHAYISKCLASVGHCCACVMQVSNHFICTTFQCICQASLIAMPAAAVPVPVPCHAMPHLPCYCLP